MAKSVRLDSDFMTWVEVHANADNRSIPKQIEHWAQIGKAAEDNPDLPYSFIKDALLATAQMKAGLATPYERPKKKNRGS